MGIEVRDIHKNFGSFVALRGVSFAVKTGELVALLGPSGSGKTTLLRIIAGLDTADSGTVIFDGEDATRRSARDRGVGFVFQHYALFRHMSVFENVAFGMRVRPRAQRPSDEAIGKRVNELLGLVQLDYLGDRLPSQLSGGQRQRVALARALAVEPKVLLLDEPFGALDAKVRMELRRWLRRLHAEIHLTSVFVTHDQEEALTMSDRLAVFNEGRIEQVGPPADVYEHPQSEFIAGFVGVSNVIERDGRRYTIRPEKINLLEERQDPRPGWHVESGVVRDVQYVGPVTRFHVTLDRGGELQVLDQNLEEGSLEVLELRGRRARVEWRSDQESVIDEVEGGSE